MRSPKGFMARFDSWRWQMNRRPGRAGAVVFPVFFQSRKRTVFSVCARRPTAPKVRPRAALRATAGKCWQRRVGPGPCTNLTSTRNLLSTAATEPARASGAAAVVREQPEWASTIGAAGAVGQWQWGRVAIKPPAKLARGYRYKINWRFYLNILSTGDF